MTHFPVNRIRARFIIGSTIFLVTFGVLFSYHATTVLRNVEYTSVDFIRSRIYKKERYITNIENGNRRYIKKRNSWVELSEMETKLAQNKTVIQYIEEEDIAVEELTFKMDSSKHRRLSGGRHFSQQSDDVESLQGVIKGEGETSSLTNKQRLSRIAQKKTRGTTAKNDPVEKEFKMRHKAHKTRTKHRKIKRRKRNKYKRSPPSENKTQDAPKNEEGKFISKRREFTTANQTCAAILKDHVTQSAPRDDHVSSVGCDLPRLDPFDESVMVFFQRLQPLACEGVMFTSYLGNLLRVIRTDDRGAPLRKITYRAIHRQPNNDEGYALGPPRGLPLNATQGMRLEHDFLQVTAEFTNGATQVDFHAHMAPLPHVINRKRALSGIPLNFVIVGLDRNSGGTFQRLLPDAYKYLRDELNAYMLEGFSILGEGTTPQLTGLLTGRTLEENCLKHEARRGFPNARTVDEWPFIFKDMKRHGYVTMFSEDAPSIGAFWMRLNGFARQPTDHYGRTLWSAVPFKDTTGLHSNCINSQPQHKLQLEYLKSLFYSYPEQPKFGFTFLGSLCHQESINTISYANEDLLEFFRFLKSSGHLDNTALIVLGDHGARFGDIRATLQGRLEERLPFLSIVLPRGFRERCHELVSNFEINTKRLVTSLDLHATLMHILKYPHDPSRSELSNGISLFSEIPESRDCEQARIPEHFCPCLLLTPVATAHAHIRLGAQAAVYKINQLLFADNIAFKLCRKLQLTKILSAVQKMPRRKVLAFSETENGIGLGIGRPVYDTKGSPQECSYVIQFQVSPGDGVFEAMISVRDRKIVVKESISRINRYGTQPKCLARERPHLRAFCLCR